MASSRSLLHATLPSAAASALALCRGSGAEHVDCETRLQGTEWPKAVAAGHRQRFALDSAVRCVSKGAPRRAMPPVRYDCGDDAFFLARSASGKTETVGIADGVSSWARYGVNPALFAWELMVHCEAAAQSSSSTEPATLLAEGYEATLREGSNRLVGSSTACLASLDCTNGFLRVANLGDSGALLLRRDGSTQLETKEQQHHFNCPFQLVSVPQGFGQGGDSPQSCDAYTAQVQLGDLLVLATDGFFDNIWQDQTREILSEMQDKPPLEIAQALVQLAYVAANSLKPSPFSAHAYKHGIRHQGGKPDDITVFVARVVPAE
eukprot:TRINITY_DN32229_c0_g1_i1.p1 TRINITY_DN32229_c0_g1~~TRINITY_DN32229_c0_g1_i1.p1  ORF type:complete len:340 (+),score=77.96 TRINITY_DN32229_c0_g1_i1:58-1020(+)